MKSLQLTIGALSVAGLILITGCGKHKAVTAAEDYATKVCACKDAKCATEAMAAYAAKAKDLKDATGTDADIKAILDADTKATACIAKVMPPPPPPAPVAEEAPAAEEAK